MPHGHCYLWQPTLVRLHVGSDALIGVSYVAISITLTYVVRKRRDLPFDWMFLAFGLFIIACGATHFMEVWTLWTPVYWLSGAVKLVTATVSVITALVLPPLVPKILALPSPGELTRVNKDLEDQIGERTRAERSLEKQATSLREQAALLDLASDTIFVRTLTGTISFWNRAAEEMYGYPRGAAIGRTLHELLKPEAPAPMDEIDAALLREGRWEGELVQTRRDGTRLVVSSRWALQRNEGGEALSVLEISRDITEEKRIAEERAEIARARADLQEEIIRTQRQQLDEMSIPIIPITERIMVMPLIGLIDSDRARLVLETALNGSAKSRAEVVILDVTGMKYLDTSVAGSLLSAARALRLLGTKTVLTGIRPDLAQTLVSAGVELSGIVTCSTLQSGIAYAMGQRSRTLTK